MKCPVCGIQKEIEKNGNYRCSKCKSLFYYENGCYEIHKYGKYKFFSLFKLLFSIVLVVIVAISSDNYLDFLIASGIILVLFPIFFTVHVLRRPNYMDKYYFDPNLYKLLFHRKLNKIDDLTKWTFLIHFFFNIIGIIFLCVSFIINTASNMA